MSQKIYEMITEKILEIMNQGTIPWHKPWNANGDTPRNLITMRPYRGINAFLLSCLGGSPYWLTFKQAKEKGGNIQKGSKGVPVIFWNWTEKEKMNEETGEVTRERIPFLRYYTVFNLNQVDCVEPPPEPEKKEHDPIKEAQAVIDNMPNPPEIIHGGDRACYSPTLDRVNMPELNAFDSAEEYYNTLFHEHGHATGHVSRLNRKELTGYNPFGSDSYSKEELVAEMTAAFLCGATGIERKTINNSAAYLQGWSSRFQDDKKMVVCAAAAAQRAADYILNNQGNNEEE